MTEHQIIGQYQVDAIGLGSADDTVALVQEQNGNFSLFMVGDDGAPDLTQRVSDIDVDADGFPDQVQFQATINDPRNRLHVIPNEKALYLDMVSVRNVAWNGYNYVDAQPGDSIVGIQNLRQIRSVTTSLTNEGFTHADPSAVSITDIYRGDINLDGRNDRAINTDGLVTYQISRAP